jgi:biofilm PGA synthesis N-glycosyltransferase PgaC
VIDDGSVDDTWNVVSKYKDVENIKLYQKQNEGSKFAALNFGLARAEGVIVGCLDADSRVDPGALRASVRTFMKEKEIMAVIPAMMIDTPNKLVEKLQKVEYEMLTFGKQTFAALQAIYVAPGPFALFRMEVFEKLGPYKEAHHTEDLEISLRMVLNGMRISFSAESLVYTKGPATVSALMHQRVRWVYGFIKNMYEYRYMVFKSKFKNVGLISLPMTTFGIFSSVITVPIIIYSLCQAIVLFAENVWTVGFHPSMFSFSWFYMNTQPATIMALILFAFLFTSIILGRKILKSKRLFSPDILLIFSYSYFSMVWTIRAMYNATLSRKSTWR